MPPIRARDLRANIKQMGFEQGTVHTVELALQELGELRQHMRELAELVSQCIDHVDRMVIVNTAMADQIKRIKREQRGEDSGEAS